MMRIPIPLAKPVLLLGAAGVLLSAPRAAGAQDALVQERNDSLVVRIVDSDLRLAVQALARYLDRPLVFGAMGEYRVTLEAPTPLPRAAVEGLLRGLLESYDLELVEGEGFYRVGRVDPRPGLPQQAVRSEVQLFVIRLRHARAADVAATVNALYGQAGALGEYGAPGPSLARSLEEDLVPPVDAPDPDDPQLVTPQVAQLAGDVTIIPDLRTNSLLIRASSRDFELISAAVQELDVRPLQVLIEVIIAEVRRDRSLALGLETVLPPNRIPGTEDTEISGANAGLGLGDFILRLMRIGGIDLSLTLEAAATRGDVSILSRPVILAANNEVAEILVGSQRPFVQVQRALPTDAPVRDQVVQFKDVGTRLSVMPTVSEDGYVMLEVSQEVNAATSEVAFDAPVISTRSVQTQLLVRDGHTAVLGGLSDRQEEFVRSGVPVLSSVPLVGALFGSQLKRTTETELFIFLTPRVVRDDQELDEVSSGVGERTRELVGDSLFAGDAR